MRKPFKVSQDCSNVQLVFRGKNYRTTYDLEKMEMTTQIEISKKGTSRKMVLNAEVKSISYEHKKWWQFWRKF